MDDSITRDMERIFGRPPVAAGTGPPARQDALPAPAPARRHARVIAASRAGVAGAGLAGAMALAGLVAFSIADRRPQPLPPPTRIVPPVARAAAAPVDVRPLPLPTTATPVARPIPTTMRVQAVPPPVLRRARPARSPVPVVRRSPSAPATTTPAAAPQMASPRLTGEALRRALADDVVVTRRLNRAVLEGPAPDPPR